MTDPFELSLAIGVLSVHIADLERIMEIEKNDYYAEDVKEFTALRDEWQELLKNEMKKAPSETEPQKTEHTQ